jgi:hypothetical protein
MVALIEKPTAGTLRLGGIDAIGADAGARGAAAADGAARLPEPVRFAQSA